MQPRLLQEVFAATSSDGSSDSDSGAGAGEGAGDGAATAVRDPKAPLIAVAEMGFGGKGRGRASSEGAGGGAGAGVSSTVECFPVVQGGISRNSSNVKTRGLQHFQPSSSKSISDHATRTVHFGTHPFDPRGILAVPGGRCRILLGQ